MATTPFQLRLGEERKAAQICQHGSSFKQNLELSEISSLFVFGGRPTRGVCMSPCFEPTGSFVDEMQANRLLFRSGSFFKNFLLT